jgi:hypothetical protein
MSAVDELPWHVAKWTREKVEEGGYTDEEIVEEIEQLSIDLDHAGERLDGKGYLPGRRFTSRDRRLVLAAIAELRGDTRSRPGPGRPGWTRERFRRHWQAALQRGGLPADAPYPAVAAVFEQLDGTIGGMNPEHLGALFRRYRADPG